MEQFSAYYLKSVAIMLLAYTVGRAILAIFAIKIAGLRTSLFLSISLGLVATIVAHAAINTRFDSVMLAIPGIFIAAILLEKFERSKKYTIENLRSKRPDRLHQRDILEFAMISIVIYAINYLSTFKNGNSLLIIEQSQDFGFYARCADYISKTGIESCNNDYIYHGPNNPYHYSDIWWVSLVNHLLGGKSILNLLLTTRTAYGILLYYGFCALNECTKESAPTLKTRILIAIATFSAPLYLSFYSKIKFLGEMKLFAQTAIETQKLAFVTLSLIVTIIIKMIGRKKLALAVFLCIPLLYTPTAPAVYLGATLSIIAHWIRSRTAPKAAILLIVLSAGHLAAYYLVFHRTPHTPHPIEMDYRNLVNFKHTINIIAGSIIAHTLIYLPLIFYSVHLLISQREKRQLLIAASNDIVLPAIAIAPAVGLLCWSVTSGDANSVQFFYNISMPVFFIGSTLLLIHAASDAKILVRVIATLILGSTSLSYIHSKLSSPAGRSEEFWLKILANNRLFTNGLYATYKEPDYYQSVFQYYEKGNNFGNFTLFVRNNTQPISLDLTQRISAPDPNFQRMANQAISASTIYIYSNQPQQSHPMTISELHTKFIEDNNIRVLISLDKYTLPEYLERLVVERIKDDVSGEVLYRLAEPSAP